MIQKVRLGEHENVYHAEFGNGDIAVVPARSYKEKHLSAILFYNQEALEIGSVSEQFLGISTEDKKPDLVLKFKSYKSVDVLIEALELVKKELMEINESQKEE